MSGSWRGKNPIQRNAIIALAHFKDETAIPDLAQLLKDDHRPMIRSTCAWALGEIGTEASKEVLEEVITTEKESDVQKEIERALEQIEKEVEA